MLPANYPVFAPAVYFTFRISLATLRLMAITLLKMYHRAGRQETRWALYEFQNPRWFNSRFT